jgi:endo-1,4-beta-xylanase
MYAISGNASGTTYAIFGIILNRSCNYGMGQGAGRKQMKYKHWFLFLGICFSLSACSAGKTGAVAVGSLVEVESPSLTPFQPEIPSPTPSASETPAPTITPTPLPFASESPAGGDTLRSSADALGFRIGTLYQAQEARNSLFLPVVTSEFNTVMLTTFMRKTQPERDRFDWSLADTIYLLASNYGMQIVGGPLVYDNSTAPDWLGFSGADCGGWDAEALEGILRSYVQTVVSHFRGAVDTWEVVNEPLTNGENCWSKILGPQYIDRALEYAHEADPNARLMLNERFGRMGVERETADSFLALVLQLRQAGLPVEVAGIEMHLNADILDAAYADEFRYLLDRTLVAGLTVFITEMDVYQGPPGYFTDPFEVQKRVYKTITRTCLEFPNCTHLIVWGISDRYTWLSRMEAENYIDPRPLLFDWQFQPKPAYFGVLEALQEAEAGSSQ